MNEFNSSEGKEKGIYVQAYTKGSVPDLEEAVISSIEEKVGAEAMPDIFSSYPDTAYAVEESGADFAIFQSILLMRNLINMLIHILKREKLQQIIHLEFSRLLNLQRSQWSTKQTGMHLLRQQVLI